MTYRYVLKNGPVIMEENLEELMKKYPQTYDTWYKEVKRASFKPRFKHHPPHHHTVHGAYYDTSDESSDDDSAESNDGWLNELPDI